MLPYHGYWLILPLFLFLYKQLQMFFYLVYNTALSDNKISLFNLLFKIQPEYQSEFLA